MYQLTEEKLKSIIMSAIAKGAVMIQELDADMDAAVKQILSTLKNKQ